MMKFLRFPLVRMIIGMVMVVASVVGAAVIFEFATKGLTLSHEAHDTLISLWLVATALCAYVAFVRLLERRPATELTPLRAPLELAMGCAVGAGLFFAVIATLWTAGDFEFMGTNDWHVLAIPFALSLQSAFIEELAVRGVMFRILEEWLGTWISLLLTASFFGGLHLLNPNSTVMGAVAIACSAGVILAGAYALTRRLWLPIGLHFGWNFVESGVFDLPVSGHKLKGLVQCRLEGPEWLTGGSFGPEASVVVIVLGLAVGAAFFVTAARSGRIVPPPWRRRVLAAEPTPLPN
jgi:membrane protease YdiL (CAAX protease family)